MKIAKKIAAALLAAAMAFTALVIPVGADSIENTSTAITSGKSVSTKIPYDNDTSDFKIVVNDAGTLKLSIESHISEVCVYVFDSNGELLDPKLYEATSGRWYSSTRGRWNKTIEKFQGTISYSVEKGTYYISLSNYPEAASMLQYNAYNNEGEVKFTATYPSATAKKAKISYININLAKGSTLSLGATVTNGGTVTWKSSNSSVVTVSSAGSITAKGKGSAIITAKCGSSSKKVKIVVS